jgi:hypothetical protein
MNLSGHSDRVLAGGDQWSRGPYVRLSWKLRGAGDAAGTAKGWRSSPLGRKVRENGRETYEPGMGTGSGYPYGGYGDYRGGDLQSGLSGSGGLGGAGLWPRSGRGHRALGSRFGSGFGSGGGLGAGSLGSLGSGLERRCRVALVWGCSDEPSKDEPSRDEHSPDGSGGADAPGARAAPGAPRPGRRPSGVGADRLANAQRLESGAHPQLQQHRDVTGDMSPPNADLSSVGGSRA